MRPYLLRLPEWFPAWPVDLSHVVVYSYGVCLAVALFLGSLLGMRLVHGRSGSGRGLPAVALAMVITGVGGAVGANLLLELVAGSSTGGGPSLATISLEPLLGVPIGAVAGVLMGRCWGIPAWAILDGGAVGSTIGAVFASLGTFLAGGALGGSFDGPGAVTMLRPSYPLDLPLLAGPPASLSEAIDGGGPLMGQVVPFPLVFALLLAGLFVLVYRSALDPSSKGKATSWFLVGYGLVTTMSVLVGAWGSTWTTPETIRLVLGVTMVLGGVGAGFFITRRGHGGRTA